MEYVCWFVCGDLNKLFFCFCHFQVDNGDDSSRKDIDFPDIEKINACLKKRKACNFIETAMGIPVLREAMKKTILKEIDKQCKDLCSQTKGESSVLRVKEDLYNGLKTFFLGKGDDGNERASSRCA